MRLNPFRSLRNYDRSNYSYSGFNHKKSLIRIELSNGQIDLFPLDKYNPWPLMHEIHTLGLKYAVKSEKVFSASGICFWFKVHVIKRRFGTRSYPMQSSLKWKHVSRATYYEMPISLREIDNQKLFDRLQSKCREFEGREISFDQLAQAVLRTYNEILPPEQAHEMAKRYLLG